MQKLVNSAKYLFSGTFFKELYNSEAVDKREQVYKLLMLMSFLVYFVSSFVIVKDFGVSGDEVNSHNQAERVFKYFAEGDSAAYIDTPGYLNLYGLSGNVIAGFIAKAFDDDQLWDVRHKVNILYASIGIIYMGLIGIRVAGGLGGLISMLFLILTPRFFGHSFNNLLDVPFAVGYIVSTYYIIRFFDSWPKIRLVHAIGLVLGIGFTISNRAPGVMLFAYFFLYAGLFYVFELSKKEFWKVGKFRKDILRFIIWALPIVITSYGLGLSIWPYGLENPLKAVPNVLEHFSLIPVYMTTVFNGVQGLSNTFPRTYAPVYLIIGIPLFSTIGFVTYFVLLFNKKRFFDIAVPFIVFTAIFPVAYIVYKKANLYSGMRHLMFIIPSILLVATAGWVKLIRSFRGRKQLIPVSILIILMFLPIRHMIANHPNHYVYFNETIGGMKGAYANYDMDYFYNSVKAGSEWLKENEAITNDTITIITNASYVGYFDDYPNVHMTYSRYYDTSNKDWDYAIYANVFIRREQLLSDWFPPQNAIHTIDVDGYPAAFIFKRTSREDLKGFNALKANKLKEAKQHFKNYLADFPNNEQVLEGYARVMIRERKFDSTLVYANRALDSNPKQAGALLLKASALNTQKRYKEALDPCNTMIELKEDFADAHFQKGYALKNLNNPNEALKEFQKANAQKENNHQALMQMAEIMVNYKRYDQAFKFYNDILKFKENDIFSLANSAKCQHLSNNNNKAEEILAKVPARNQNHFEVVKTKARIALSKNDMQNANRYVSMARNINNNADMFVIRGLFYLKRNQKDMAKTHLDKAIELDPINREAQELLKSLQSQNKPAQSQTQQQKPAQQQSIMFQKPKPKQTSPIKVPSK